MEPGLYDHLLTKAIEVDLARLDDPRLVALAPVDSEESYSVLAQYLERLIASSLPLHRGSDAAEKQRQLVERIVGMLTKVLSEQDSNRRICARGAMRGAGDRATDFCLKVMRFSSRGNLAMTSGHACLRRRPSVRRLHGSTSLTLHGGKKLRFG
jgi:hypothetical protein